MLKKVFNIFNLSYIISILSEKIDNSKLKKSTHNPIDVDFSIVTCQKSKCEIKAIAKLIISNEFSIRNKHELKNIWKKSQSIQIKTRKMSWKKSMCKSVFSIEQWMFNNILNWIPIENKTKGKLIKFLLLFHLSICLETNY